MALFRITVKKSGCFSGGYRLEKGMSVEYVVNYSVSPLACHQSENIPAIAQLFKNKYGVDLLRSGLINNVYMEAERIG